MRGDYMLSGVMREVETTMKTASKFRRSLKAHCGSLTATATVHVPVYGTCVWFVSPCDVGYFLRVVAANRDEDDGSFKSHVTYKKEFQSVYMLCDTIRYQLYCLGNNRLPSGWRH